MPKTSSNLVLILLLISSPFIQLAQKSAQESETTKPIVLKLDQDGERFVRLVMWHQFWISSNNLSENSSNLQINPSIRRSRILAYAQISPDFLILTHIGLNSLNTNTMTALGNDGDGAQLFLHGAWGEYRINQYLYIGGGLHYWNGLTRMSSQSTLNFMSLDQPRPFIHWHSLGITDQFARHLGIYAKGQFKKLDYRLALNAPSHAPMSHGKDYGLKDSGLSYTGVLNADRDGNATGNMILEGYIRYNFWDQESNVLPYNVGTYLGEKRVFALGAGFYSHPNGMYESSSGSHSAVRHLAIDGFLEYPVESGAFNAYASIMQFYYGANYVGRWAGTGTSLYGQLGYFLKPIKLMPYLAYQSSSFDGLYGPISSLDLGINYFLRGHHAKITLEYHQIKGDIRETAISAPNDLLTQFRCQFQLYL